ncbi:MAG: CsbD family protein [Acidimicrobiia bacterium]
MDRDSVGGTGDWSDQMIDEGRWDQARGKIRETWGEIIDEIIDDEFDQSRGNWDQLVGKIKEKSGETTEAIEGKLRDWFS